MSSDTGFVENQTTGFSLARTPVVDVRISPNAMILANRSPQCNASKPALAFSSNQRTKLGLPKPNERLPHCDVPVTAIQVAAVKVFGFRDCAVNSHQLPARPRCTPMVLRNPGGVGAEPPQGVRLVSC